MNHPTDRLAPTTPTVGRTSRRRSTMQALLDDGPLQGKPVEVEPVEGRPPKTIELQDEDGNSQRYCLSEWSQEGMTAVYTFLYTV